MYEGKKTEKEKIRKRGSEKMRRRETKEEGKKRENEKREKKKEKTGKWEREKNKGEKKIRHNPVHCLWSTNIPPPLLLIFLFVFMLIIG